MSVLLHVFFDANEGTYEQGYWLTLPSSKHDLDALKDTLKEGTRVIIYSPGELEMEATLAWDCSLDGWIALPVPNTTTYLNGTTSNGS